MLTRFRRRFTDETGISLVELLVVILLMTVIGGYATSSLVKGMQLTASTQSRFDALADLQRSVDRMTRELRAAAPLQVGGSPVVVAEPDRVVVNVFRNDFTEQRRFTYRYCATQQTLHARVEGPVPAPSGTPPAITCGATSVPVLITDVSNGATAVFTYFNAAGAPTTVPAQVQRIRVRVTRELPNQSPITVETMVRLRNAR